MKKNLTLLMMLAAFVGILSAQSGPKFNYQAVVRNADTLVYNQEMTVAIDVTDGINCYSETHTATSTQNGLVSVVVGEGTPVACGSSSVVGDLARIDWSVATIAATFSYDAVTLTSSAPVNPVPYAIQAGVSLTTEIIADYMRNTLTTQDAKDILSALVLYNDDLQQALEDTIEVFLKAHKDIALDVAKAYLEHLDAGNIQELFDALDANPEGKAMVKKVLKHFIISKRELAKELTLWYLDNATPDDIERTYNTLMQVPAPTKDAVKDTLLAYMKNHLEQLSQLGIYIMDNVTYQEAHQAYSYLKLTNPNDVNGQLRDTLNHYIEMYLAMPGNGPETVPSTTRVNNAINNYLNNHNVVLECNDIDPCDIKELYDTYTAQP